MGERAWDGTRKGLRAGTRTRDARGTMELYVSVFPTRLSVSTRLFIFVHFTDWNCLFNNISADDNVHNSVVIVN